MTKEKTTVEITKEQAKIVILGIEEQMHTLDKLVATCIKEGVPEGAKRITDRIKEMDTIRHQFEEVAYPNN